VHILPFSQRVPLNVTFIGLYLGDEATQTTRTNFSEHTLNPPTSPRSLSVEFIYILYDPSVPSIVTEDGDSTLLRNVGFYQPVYIINIYVTVSLPETLVVVTASRFVHCQQ
jgi:hypothetical protein